MVLYENRPENRPENCPENRPENRPGMKYSQTCIKRPP